MLNVLYSLSVSFCLVAGCYFSLHAAFFVCNKRWVEETDDFNKMWYRIAVLIILLNVMIAYVEACKWLIYVKTLSPLAEMALIGFSFLMLMFLFFCILFYTFGVKNNDTN